MLHYRQYAVFPGIGYMRAIFIASFLTNLIIDLASLAILPDRVAIHFGMGGTPNGWATNLMNTLLMLGMHTLLFITLYFAPRLSIKLPGKWNTVPNRDYWLKPEHRSQAMAKFNKYIWQFGSAMFLFMLFANLLTLKANLSDPVQLDERLLLIALAIFLGYMVFWIVALVRAFRIPPDS